MSERILPYDRGSAVEYAHRWAYARNPAYYDFSQIGGDCTNFASQCVYAGAGIMNMTPVYGWYYLTADRRTASWTGVEYLYNFLTGNEGAGPFAEETAIERAMPGDIAQLSFGGGRYGHSPVIVSVGEKPDMQNILVAAHTNDTDYKPLGTYAFIKCRILHITGVRR